MGYTFSKSNYVPLLQKTFIAFTNLETVGNSSMLHFGKSCRAYLHSLCKKQRFRKWTKSGQKLVISIISSALEQSLKPLLVFVLPKIGAMKDQCF